MASITVLERNEYLAIADASKTYKVQNGLLAGVIQDPINDNFRLNEVFIKGDFVTGYSDLLGLDDSVLLPVSPEERGQSEVMEAEKKQYYRLKSLANLKSRQKVKHRLIECFAWMSANLELNTFNHEDQLYYKVVITHENLANLLGTTRVTITKLLQSLEEDNLIYRKKRVIGIPSQLAIASGLY